MPDDLVGGILDKQKSPAVARTTRDRDRCTGGTPMQDSTPDKNVWPILAGLRFFLASIVVFGHVGIIVPIGHAFEWWRQFSGHGAVIGFFVVSGYSIAASITERPDGFLKRRANRILPVYWFSLIVSCIPFLQHGVVYISTRGISMEAPTIMQFIGNCLLLQGFATTMFLTFGQAWSLSIEAFYYILAPLINRLTLKWISLVIAGSGIFYVTALTHFGNIHLAMYGVTAIGLLWSWLAGFAFYKFGDQDIVKCAFLVIGVILLRQFDISAGNAWELYLLTAIVVLCAKHIPVNPWLSKVLKFAGEISYPLYMIHFGVMCILDGLGVRSPLIMAISAYAAAVITYYLVDLPSRWYLKYRLTVKPLWLPLTASAPELREPSTQPL